MGELEVSAKKQVWEKENLTIIFNLLICERARESGLVRFGWFGFRFFRRSGLELGRYRRMYLGLGPWVLARATKKIAWFFLYGWSSSGLQKKKKQKRKRGKDVFLARAASDFQNGLSFFVVVSCLLHG